jgi:hypothetical protein
MRKKSEKKSENGKKDDTPSTPCSERSIVVTPLPFDFKRIVPLPSSLSPLIVKCPALGVTVDAANGMDLVGGKMTERKEMS